MSLTSQERSSKGASTTRLPTPAALRQDSLPSSAREGPIPFSLKERFHDGRRDHRGARLAAASRRGLLPRELSRLRGPGRTSSFDGDLLPAACGRGLALASHRRGGNLALV